MALMFTNVSNDRGIAIVAVTIVLVVVALLGAVIIYQTNHDTELSNSAYEDTQVVYYAESAKERGYQEMLNDAAFTTLGNPGSLSDQPMPGGTYDLTATTLQDTPNPKVVRLTATGSTDSDNSREVNVVAEVIQENVFVWNNAIFGGSGQVGGVINGNCAIHGSVHLLGENVASGNNTIEALDLSGASLIHNNYVGMPAALASKVPALDTAVFGGENVDTIEAKLRVKNGSVGVSGSSEIGEMNVAGNAWKETMDGIYIETDASDTRWSGNQVTDGVPDPDSVQSDNGTNALYDLGDAVAMPDLMEPYDDPVTGMTYATYESYYDLAALSLPPLTLDNSSDAANAILAYQAAGLFPAGTVVEVDAATGKFSVTAFNPLNVGNPNTIKYDPSIGFDADLSLNIAGLEVNGLVQVEGNLVIGEKNSRITYAGKGTMFAAGDGTAAGDIEVHSSMLPVGTFPTDSVLGFMAKNDIYLATAAGDSQLMMAGAFYAGGEIVSAKQNEILGTFVGNYFDMGTNVPKIYQVPALAENLPPGLIGSKPIWVVTGFRERSWQIEDSPVAFTGGG